MMVKVLGVVVLGLWASLAGQAVGVTVQEDAEARNVLSGLFAGDRNLIPKAVRLVFHDCFESGCDGCIDPTLDGHKGLAGIVSLLNDLYEDGEYTMSRADFYVLASVVALDAASAPVPQRPTKGRGRGLKRGGGGGPPPGGPPPGGPPPGGDDGNVLGGPPLTDGSLKPTIVMEYGRLDCDAGTNMSGSDLRAMPNPHGGIAHVLEVMGPGSEMDLTQQEVVALIAGAHSLGGARTENSGFNGDWTSHRTTFNNEFFHRLLQPWDQDPVNNGQNFQWSLTRGGPPPGGQGGPPPGGQGGPPPGGRGRGLKRKGGSGRGGGANLFMLNTDIALLHNISPDESGEDQSACRQNTGSAECPPSVTAPIVRSMASDTSSFLTHFESAFTKMIYMGAPMLDPPEEN